MTKEVSNFLDERDAADEESFVVSFWFHMVGLACLEDTRRTSGGSIPGKSPNIYREYAGTHMFYMVKYFWPSDQARPGTSDRGPQQPEATFETRFRMPKNFFILILHTIIPDSPYLQQVLCLDGTGRLGITPLFKVICATCEL